MKPVEFLDFDEDAEKQLPDDAMQLYNAIFGIVEYGGAVFPAAVRREITGIMKGRPPPMSWFRAAEEGTMEVVAGESAQKDIQEDAAAGSGASSLGNNNVLLDASPPWAWRELGSLMTPARLARAEFYVVRNLEREARRCLDLRQSEAAWNGAVPGPLLELALWRHRPRLEHYNATSAKILPAFVPSFDWGDVAEGKMVDFTVSLCYERQPGAADDTGGGVSDADVYAAIRARVSAWSGLGGSEAGVNQTAYTPLLLAPIAVSIETKVGGASLEDGRVQLAVWTAAWHLRMSKLGVGKRSTPSDGVGGAATASQSSASLADDSGWSGRLVTLPLILTLDHDWNLYFACDRGTKIVSRHGRNLTRFPRWP